MKNMKERLNNMGDRGKGLIYTYSEFNKEKREGMK